MPSFDVVSEIDHHELTNAIDQANREVSNRFDFKGTNSRIEHTESVLTILSASEFQIKQIHDILTTNPCREFSPDVNTRLPFVVLVLEELI